MSDQITFTAEELKTFFKISPLTVEKILEFVQKGTDQKYVIVEKAFVKAIIEQLFDNILNIFKVNDALGIIWMDIIQSNKRTMDKWDKHLDVLKDEKTEHSSQKIREYLLNKRNDQFRP